MSPRAASRLEDLGFEHVYDYVAGKQDWLARGLPAEGTWCKTPHAGDRLDRDVPTCGLADTVGEVRQRLRETGYDVCVVVDERRVVQGLLRQADLSTNPDARAEEVMECGPSTFRASVPIKEMEDYFREHHLSSAPITTPDGVLLGLLRRT